MSILHLQLSASRAKQVTRLLANDTARRIMDSLSSDSKSETELAKELNLPLSTVHYNVQKLQESGLLKTDEYTYSEKGKQMRHYSLASDHVLITTKPLNSLPSILGGAALAVTAAAATFFVRRPQEAAQDTMRAFVADAEAAMMAPQAVEQAANPLIWPWILLGATAMLLGMLIVVLVQRYRS